MRDDRRVRLRVGPSWGRETPPYNERGLKAQRQQALTLLGTHPVVEIWLMALTLYCTTPQLGFSLSVQRQPAFFAREAACWLLFICDGTPTEMTPAARTSGFVFISAV